MAERMNVSTHITVPARIWVLLRRLSEDLALADGGRPSPSRVIADLVEREAARRAEAEEPRA
jgi:hypothetical protein